MKTIWKGCSKLSTPEWVVEIQKTNAATPSYRYCTTYRPNQFRPEGWSSVYRGPYAVRSIASIVNNYGMKLDTTTLQLTAKDPLHLSVIKDCIKSISSVRSDLRSLKTSFGWDLSDEENNLSNVEYHLNHELEQRTQSEDD